MQPNSSLTSQDTPDGFAELIVRYLEGDLPESGIAALRTKMASDPACRELFVSMSLQRCALVADIRTRARKIASRKLRRDGICAI